MCEEEAKLTLTSTCHVSCLVFLKSANMLFTLFPTIPASLAALRARVASTAGSQAGGGLKYGKAWIRLPKPSTAACRVRMSLLCSGVGVPGMRLLGSWFFWSMSVNFAFSDATILSRRTIGEHLIMPERVVAAPMRTSSWTSASIAETQSNISRCCFSDMRKRRRK